MNRLPEPKIPSPCAQFSKLLGINTVLTETGDEMARPRLPRTITAELAGSINQVSGVLTQAGTEIRKTHGVQSRVYKQLRRAADAVDRVKEEIGA
jgi:hypothetical protein